jgi:hypothetical protein
MRASSNEARAILATLAAVALCTFASTSSPGDEPKGPADKTPALTLDEKYEKLKGGILKSTEAEVVALMGPAHSMVRPVKHDKGDIELRWQFATRIVVTYKGGKVSEVWGTFSEHLPVEKVTPANLRKVQPGMTEKEVIDILGDRYAGVGMDGVETGQWGRRPSSRWRSARTAAWSTTSGRTKLRPPQVAKVRRTALSSPRLEQKHFGRSRRSGQRCWVAIVASTFRCPCRLFAAPAWFNAGPSQGA